MKNGQNPLINKKYIKTLNIIMEIRITDLPPSTHRTAIIKIGSTGKDAGKKKSKLSSTLGKKSGNSSTS